MTNDTCKLVLKPAVLIDIDGVICNVGYEVGPVKFKWMDFMDADLTRKPIIEGIALVKMFIAQGLYPVFLTARPEFMREQTEQMLAEYGFHGKLFMASTEASLKGGDHYQTFQMLEKDRVIKANKLMETYNFMYAIDDQTQNAELFESLGIPSLQPRFI